jgi:hypothetical protein
VSGASMFDDGGIKMEHDFKLKIFNGCVFAFGIQRSFVKP